MTTKLIELWVIDRSGLSLFHIQNPKFPGGQNINPMLFSGFLTAVESMAEGSIEAIKMKDSKILILPSREPIKIFIVGRTGIKERDDGLRKTLDKVRELFLQEFQEILPSWAGNHDIFEYFANVVTPHIF